MAFSSLLLALTLGAQSLSPAASACTPIADYQLLAAWIGEWDVKTPADQPAGSSRIERSPDGCGIVEHWLGRQPNGGSQPGTGLHAYDLAGHQWRHLWIDASGFSAALIGKVEAGRVVYERTSQLGNGVTRYHRMTLEPKGATIVQTGEHSDDGMKTWSRDFQLTYTRHE